MTKPVFSSISDQRKQGLIQHISFLLLFFFPECKRLSQSACVIYLSCSFLPWQMKRQPFRSETNHPCLAGSCVKQRWCNRTGSWSSLQLWPDFYKEHISFLLLISHNAFLRCANKLPGIHIHKLCTQTNDELSTLSQQERRVKWKWNIQSTPYLANNWCFKLHEQ